MGVELYAKTLGLIGAGNIGSIVADRANGLKMKVVAYDPFLSPERAVEIGVEKVELAGLARQGRHHNPAHPAHRQDPQHPVGRRARRDEEGCADCELRPRRPGRRGRRCVTGPRERPDWRRWLRRLRRGAGQGKRAVRRAGLHRHPPSRRVYQRGAGECRPASRGADERLPSHRSGDQRAQQPLDHGRRSPQAEAVRRVGREARNPSPVRWWTSRLPRRGHRLRGGSRAR